jgi:hypothetical protein
MSELLIAAGENALPVLRIADLPHALAGQPNRVNDVDLLPPCVVGLPDGVKERVIRGILSRLVALVLACQPAQLVCFHDLTIQCANRLDKRGNPRPRWLA